MTDLLIVPGAVQMAARVQAGDIGEQLGEQSQPERVDLVELELLPTDVAVFGLQPRESADWAAA